MIDGAVLFRLNRQNPSMEARGMRNYCRFVAIGLAVGVLLAAPGCGAKAETSQSKTAAIGGPKTDDGQTPPDSSKTDGTQSAPDPLHPVVKIETSAGGITVKLDAENAPLTVENFLSYVERGHYDQTIFHQVLEDYVILGGTYTSELVEKESRTPIRNEAHNGLKNRRGTIAMARQVDSIDSATCQFFLNVSNNPVLDHKDRTLEGYGYCTFGQITEGLEVVDQISKTKVHDTDKLERIPIQTVLIKSIRRIR